MLVLVLLAIIWSPPTLFLAALGSNSFPCCRIFGRCWVCVGFFLKLVVVPEISLGFCPVAFIRVSEMLHMSLSLVEATIIAAVDHLQPLAVTLLMHLLLLLWLSSLSSPPCFPLIFSCQPITLLLSLNYASHSLHPSFFKGGGGWKILALKQKGRAGTKRGYLF